MSSKGTRFFAQAVLFTVLWLLALYHPGFAVPLGWERIVPIVGFSGHAPWTWTKSSRTRISPQLPLYAIISFGAYSLASIGYSLFTFRDCPEAYESLMKVRGRREVRLGG